MYERKKKNFRLGRIARIIDRIFTRWNEKDSPVGPRGGSEAPTASIFYIFQRAEVWLENRDVFFPIFQQHFSPDFARLDSLKGLPEYAIALEEFYRRFDEFVNIVGRVADILAAINKEILGPVVKVLKKVIDFYWWVREHYPIIPKE